MLRTSSYTPIALTLSLVASACGGEEGGPALGDASLDRDADSMQVEAPASGGGESEEASSGGQSADLGPREPSTGGEAPGAGGSSTGGTASNTGGSSTGGTAPETENDECDNTEQCVASYGAGATDCVDSLSDNSWCDCGGKPCSEDSTPVEPVDPPTADCPDTGKLPPDSEWRFFDIRGPGDNSNYYSTRDDVESFKTDDPDGEGAIERSERASYFWTGSSDWAQLCLHYDSKRGGGSIFQIKIRDEPVPVLMVARTSDGIRISHGNTVKGQTLKTSSSFDLRVRNNGTRSEVYVDGKLWVSFDDARSGLHFFKYGLYHGKNAFQDLEEGSLLEVSNVSLTLKDPIKNP